MNAQTRSDARHLHFRAAERSRLETLTFASLWAIMLAGVLVTLALALSQPWPVHSSETPALAQAGPGTSLVSAPRRYPRGQLQAELRTTYHMIRYLLDVEMFDPSRSAPAVG